LQAGRWRRIADLLQAASDGDVVGRSLAELATEFLGADHTSLTFVADARPVSSLGGPAAVDLCRLQFALGEGPAWDAVRVGDPVLIDDVSAAESENRWPRFLAAARERRIGAVFAFPLRIGSSLVGVMTAHRAAAGPLTDEQYADALIVATLATIGMLQIEAGGSLGRVEARFSTESGPGAVVGVAAAAVSEQLGVTVVEALVRIRARAFVEGRDIEQVARDIAEGRLRLER